MKRKKRTDRAKIVDALDREVSRYDEQQFTYQS